MIPRPVHRATFIGSAVRDGYDMQAEVLRVENGIIVARWAGAESYGPTRWPLRFRASDGVQVLPDGSVGGWRLELRAEGQDVAPAGVVLN
jgi:hypothetical protein